MASIDIVSIILRDKFSIFNGAIHNYDIVGHSNSVQIFITQSRDKYISTLITLHKKRFSTKTIFQIYTHFLVSLKKFA